MTINERGNAAYRSKMSDLWSDQRVEAGAAPVPK